MASIKMRFSLWLETEPVTRFKVQGPLFYCYRRYPHIWRACSVMRNEVGRGIGGHYSATVSSAS